MNEHEFVCELCGKKQLHDAGRGHVPPGWKMKKINEEVLQLCDACANPGHWTGGPSPSIQEMYRNKFGKEITEHQNP